MTDGSEKLVNSHLSAPIEAPRIKSIKRKDVQLFLAARISYEHAVEEQDGLKPVSVRSSFDAEYLEALVLAEAFGIEIDEVSKCTDKVLLMKLKEIVGDVQNVDYDIVMQEVRSHLRLDATEDNVKNRILMLSVDYLKFCKKRGWSFYKDSQKVAIHHICSALQPPALKKRIESALKLENNV